MLLRRPDPSGGRLAPEARLLQIKVPLDAAHHFRADLARVAQGQDGFPFGREQFAPPLAPVPGALGVLMARAAGLEARRVALYAPLVASTSPTASITIGLSWARRSSGEEENAAEFSRGGRKTTKITSGGISMSGRPGTKPITRPPRTSKIG